MRRLPARFRGLLFRSCKEQTGTSRSSICCRGDLGYRYGRAAASFGQRLALDKYSALSFARLALRSAKRFPRVSLDARSFFHLQRGQARFWQYGIQVEQSVTTLFATSRGTPASLELRSVGMGTFGKERY